MEVLSNTDGVPLRELTPMKKAPIALAILASFAATTDAQDPSSSVPESAVKGITAKELGGHMRFLASDLMKGRDTASEEIRLAGEYIATRLYSFGAEPA